MYIELHSSRLPLILNQRFSDFVFQQHRCSQKIICHQITGVLYTIAKLILQKQNSNTIQITITSKAREHDSNSVSVAFFLYSCFIITIVKYRKHSKYLNINR